MFAISRKLRILLMLSFSVMMLSSCVSEGTSTDEIESSVSTTENDILTLSPSETKTTSITPIPTMDEKAAEDLVQMLFETNGGCNLPCWWGLTPGETYWPTARNYLDSFASYQSQRTITLMKRVYFYSFPLLETDSFVDQNYYVEENEIVLIESYLPFNVLPLSELLESYGVPNEVLVRTSSSSRNFSLPYRVILFYPGTGILALFNGEAVESGDNIKICPQGIEIGFLMLWEPENQRTLEELLSPNYGFGEALGFLQLTDVSEWDEETFHQEFSTQKSSLCIFSPKNNWTTH